MPSHVPSDVSTEVQISGTFASSASGINFRARAKDSIRITRGLQDQQGAVAAATSTFTLHNPNGLFTDDNPLSPLFGKVGLNTRVRHGIKKSGNWDEYLRLPDYNLLAGLNWAYTADKASLDIVGDIDIRVEITSFYQRNQGPQMVMGKWESTGEQRSYAIWLNDDGAIAFRWSTLGTSASTNTVISTYKVPESAGRIALRVTLDVDAGATNKTVTFYSSDSINGTWTQVATSTTAGTTSIFSGSATLSIGANNSGNAVFTNHTNFRGKIHAMQVRSGIGGTLVADFAPAGKGVEATTWVDTCASPNTWIITGSVARLASDRIRFCGEMSSLPDSWDTTGTDLYVPATAYGLLNRYQSNKGALRGALYRRYRTYASLTGYWPCEDSSTATSVANAVAGAGTGKAVGGTFGTPTGFDGSTGALTLTTQNTSYANFKIIQGTNTGFTTFIFYMKFSSLPVALTEFVQILMPFQATANRWSISISSTQYQFTAYAADGTTVATTTTSHGTDSNPSQNWVAMELMISQEGGNVRWETIWAGVNQGSFYTHNPGGSTFAGTMRQFDNVLFKTTAAEFAGVQIAHVILANSLISLASTTFRNAGKAYAGEAFLIRALRLTAEEGIFMEWKGDPNSTELCGPQTADTLFNILAAGAKVDGGLLSDIRDRIGFHYISGQYLGNRKGLSLSYAANQPFELGQRINDNRYTVNDFTASRTGGSSARYVADDDRRLNVREPDASSPGIGRYERADSFNANSDDQLYGLAARTVNFGTYPGRRIPSLAIALHRSQIFSTLTLFNDTIAADMGDPITITGMSAAPTPPEDLNLNTFGYTETLDGFLWNVVHNTVPQGPFNAPVLGDYFTGKTPRLDNSASRVHALQAGVASGSTTFKVRTPKLTSAGTTEPPWVDSTSYSAEFPVDIMMNGERMTLTAATASSADMTLQSGTFESATDVNDWTTISCTFTSSTTFAQAGTRSGLITTSGSPSFAAVRNKFPDNIVPVSPGDVLTLNIYVRSVAALSDVRIVMDWLNSSMGFVSNVDSGLAALASGAWVLRTLTATVPAGVAYMQYGPSINTPAAGTLLYIDSITLTNASVNYQTLTVTRAVNGIARAHAVNSMPYLFEQFFLGSGT